MKKLIVLIAALLAALLIAGCTSKPAAPTGPSASELMASAKGNAPDGVLVAQATGRGGSKEDAIKKAEQNAILQLVRGMSYIVSEMIDEQAAGGRLSASIASDFKSNIQTSLTRVSLAEVVKVESGTGAGDVGYAVYYLDKAETQKVLTKVVNAAKEVVAAGNFNFSNYDAKFAAAITKEWKN
jgi:PBP1b-binding outer membrane lipoprotein LpoB